MSQENVRLRAPRDALGDRCRDRRDAPRSRLGRRGIPRTEWANRLRPGRSPTSRPVIFTMKPNGSDQRRLDRRHDPGYSPNGRQIVFVARRDGDSEIFTIRANGTHRRQLTDNTGIEDIDPAYSPNGRQIVFSRKRSGGYEIFKMRSDGTHRRQLTHDSTGRGVVGATFSPSGRQIAYVQRDFRPFPETHGLFRMRPDGTHQRFSLSATTRTTPRTGGTSWPI